MKTYCLSCRKHRDNIDSKKVIMTNKVVRRTSKYANCVIRLILIFLYIKQNSL